MKYYFFSCFLEVDDDVLGFAAFFTVTVDL
jgi:hypothetical protein